MLDVDTMMPMACMPQLRVSAGECMALPAVVQPGWRQGMLLRAAAGRWCPWRRCQYT